MPNFKTSFHEGRCLKRDLNLFSYLSKIDTAFKCVLCICLLFWKEGIAVQIFLFFCHCCIWDHSRFVSKFIKYVHKSVDMLLCIVRCRSRKSIQTFLIRFLVSKLFFVQLPLIILLDMESMLACRYFCPVHLEYNKDFSHMLYKGDVSKTDWYLLCVTSIAALNQSSHMQILYHAWGSFFTSKTQRHISLFWNFTVFYYYFILFYLQDRKTLLVLFTAGKCFFFLFFFTSKT